MSNQIRKPLHGRTYCTGHCALCEQTSECPGDHYRDKDRDDRAMDRDDTHTRVDNMRNEQQAT